MVKEAHIKLTCTTYTVWSQKKKGFSFCVFSAMAGRKDKIHKLRGSRIAVAILVGILIGCVCSVLFPNGFLNSGSSSLIVNEERLSKSTSKVLKILCLKHSTFLFFFFLSEISVVSSCVCFEEFKILVDFLVELQIAWFNHHVELSFKSWTSDFH